MASPDASVLSDGALTGYFAVMLIISSVGVAGNIIAAFILIKQPYRFTPLSHLMLNLTIADLIICSTGYPVALAVMKMDPLQAGDRSLRCAWLAFVNCFIGMASVGSLTCISWSLFVTSKGIAPSSGSRNDAMLRRRSLYHVLGIWAYAFVLSSPPFFGWNRFVPFASRLSCQPQWAWQSFSDLSYLVFLVLLGFFLPLCVIVFCQGSAYRLLKRSCPTKPTDTQRRTVRSLHGAMRMTLVIIIAFFVSWSPYCAVSLASMCTGKELLSPALALFPGTMAKASAVCNPLVYAAMNRRFRRYFCKISSFGKCG